jgi:hypothetical protein
MITGLNEVEEPLEEKGKVVLVLNELSITP